MHKHADFVHLHVHTQYSLLDGMILVSKLVKQAAALPHAGGRDHRPRADVRGRRLLRPGAEGRRQADPRRRALRRPRQPARQVRRPRGLREPPDPARPRRDRLPQPRQADLGREPRGLLLQAARRQGAAARARRRPDRALRVHEGRGRAEGAPRRRGRRAEGRRRVPRHLRRGQLLLRADGQRDPGAGEGQPRADRPLEGHRHPGRRDQRLPLPAARGRPGPRGAAVHPDPQDAPGVGPDAPLDRPVLLPLPRGDGAALRRRPRGAARDGRDRRALQRRAQARRVPLPEGRGPGGGHAREPPAPARRGGPRRPSRPGRRRRAPRPVREAPGLRARRHRDRWTSRATSSRSGTSCTSPRPAASRSGRGAARRPGASRPGRSGSRTSTRSSTACSSSAS